MRIDPLTGDPLPETTKDKGLALRQGLTDKELSTMAREKLSMALQAVNPLANPQLALALSREILDRTEGKATQHIKQSIEHTNKPSAELNNTQLLAALTKASNAGLLPPGVTLLPDGNIAITDADYIELNVNP